MLQTLLNCILHNIQNSHYPTIPLSQPLFQQSFINIVVFTFVLYTPGAVPPGHICDPPIGRRCCGAGRGYVPLPANHEHSERSGGW